MSTPEALRLAEALEKFATGPIPVATELRRQHAEILQLTAENFALAAGQCVNVTADEGGTPQCAEIKRLRAERDALRAALMRVKTEAVSLADAQVIALEALKGQT